MGNIERIGRRLCDKDCVKSEGVEREECVKSRESLLKNEKDYVKPYEG